jgi:hypothetical protein
MSEGLGGKQWPRVLGRQTQLGFSGTFSEGGDWGQNNDQPLGDGEPTGCESWIKGQELLREPQLTSHSRCGIVENAGEDQA